MKTLELKRGKITTYETIKEMPIDLFVAFQKYLVQDTGIGSDMAGVTGHLGALYKYLGNGMIEEAATESYNLYQNIFLMLNKINIKHISFACFINAIDGEEITDYSETNLQAIALRAGKAGLTQGHCVEILEDLKKKLMGN